MKKISLIALVLSITLAAFAQNSYACPGMKDTDTKADKVSASAQKK